MTKKGCCSNNTLDMNTVFQNYAPLLIFWRWANENISAFYVYLMYYINLLFFSKKRKMGNTCRSIKHIVFYCIVRRFDRMIDKRMSYYSYFSKSKLTKQIKSEVIDEIIETLPTIIVDDEGIMHRVVKVSDIEKLKEQNKWWILKEFQKG